MEDKYTLGQCEICRKDTALKNGKCIECNKAMHILTDTDDFRGTVFEDLFKPFSNKK